MFFANFWFNLIGVIQMEKQDSWEDEDEEPKEEEKSADETQVVKKAKPQKNLKKTIEEREVSIP